MAVRGRRWRVSPAMAVAGACTLVISGYPLAQLVYLSIFAEGRVDLRPYARLFNGDTGAALQHTISSALVSAAAALAAGAVSALLVHRSDLPGRRAFALLLLLPLLTPPFVQAVAWLEAYARGGLTFHWWGFAVDWLRGPTGVAVLLALQSYPLVFLLVGAQVASQRGVELEEAAQASGAGQWRVLIDITLPRLTATLAAAMLIAVVSAASDFGIPAVLGIPGGYTVVTTLIYRRLSLAGGGTALADMVALSTLLALVAIAGIVMAARLTRTAAGGPMTIRRGGVAAGLRLGPLRWPTAALLSLFLGGATVLPLLALVAQSLAPAFVPTLDPSRWTAGHFGAALAHGGLQALADSAGLAAAAGLVVAAGGAAIAAISRHGGRTARAIEGLAAIPFALPGSVIAVAMILAWKQWLYGTFAIILLAYIARFAILGVRAAGASLASLPEELSQAARSSGASPWRAALDVQRPLIQPALLAGFALTFLLAVHELTISSLLYTPQTQTIAVQVLNAEQAGNVPVTTSLAVIVMAITIAAAVPLAISGRIRRLLGAELSA